MFTGDAQLSQIAKDILCDAIYIDFDFPFICADISDEILITLGNNDDEILSILSSNWLFPDDQFDQNRPLLKYSGGQKALLSTMLMILMLRSADLFNINIVLVNIIESLSSSTINSLRDFIIKYTSNRNINFYILEKNKKLHEFKI